MPKRFGYIAVNCPECNKRFIYRFGSGWQEEIEQIHKVQCRYCNTKFTVDMGKEE